jgi:hypothetical protein
LTIGRPEVVRLPKGSARRAAPIGALLSRVGQGLNHEEIGSPDGLGVVGKEGTPALAGRPGWPAARVTANGACADGDAALKRGRPRERTAGARIGASPGDAIAARSQAGPGRGRLASSGGGGDEEPEELVPSPKAWTMPGAEGDLELRTKEQVLDEEALAPAEDAGGVARTSSRSSIIGGRIADRCSPAGRSADFCPPTTLAGLQQP